jgi:hypothetical protein
MMTCSGCRRSWLAIASQRGAQIVVGLGGAAAVIETGR